MPLRRPAAARPGILKAPKAAPKPRSKPSAKPKTSPQTSRQRRQEAPETSSSWKLINQIPPETLPLGSRKHVKLAYGSEKGEANILLKDRVEDAYGHWIGAQVLGTNVASLRQWQLMNPADKVYLGTKVVRESEKAEEIGLGYLLEVNMNEATVTEPWAENCSVPLPNPPGVADENPDLRQKAMQFGFSPGQNSAGAADPPSPGEGPQGQAKKKKSKKQQVKEMVLKSNWTPARTPLDPSYRRPIKIRMSQKRKASSSSGSTTRSSSTSEDRSSDHQVHRVAKKLPGYLARCCCKEASNLLAQDVGEEGSTYVVMQKYYRQILLRRGGSRPLLREMATLSWGMDLLLQGKILQLADLLAQRLKALELIQQGTTGDLAAQLELLPKESQGLSSQAEARIAKSEFFQETKLANQLKGKGKRPFAPPPPQGKEGKGTGKSWDKRGTKGKKGDQPQSKMVEVGP